MDPGEDPGRTIRRPIVLFVSLLLVVTSFGGGVVAVGPPADELPHAGPAWLYPPLLTEVEVQEITLSYPMVNGKYEPGVGWFENSDLHSGMHQIYGAGVEDPTYVIGLRFIHGEGNEQHEDLGGTAFRRDFEDEITRTAAGYPPKMLPVGPVPRFEDDNIPPWPLIHTHTLFEKEPGIGGTVIINEFQSPHGDYERGGGFTSKHQRFLLAGPDGYKHLHCSPTEEMEVAILVIESDDESNIGRAATAVGAAVSVVLSLAVTGGVGTAVLSAGASAGAGEAINYFFENEDDIIGVGHGSLSHNGETRIDILAAEWTDEANGDITVYRNQTRGYIDFDARTRTLADAHPSLGGDGTPEPSENLKKCNEGSNVPPEWLPKRVQSTTPTTPATVEGDEDLGNATEQGAFYLHSLEEALALVTRLERQGLPTESLPASQRSIVRNGVNLEVGSATLGFDFNEGGDLTRTSLIGKKNPSMSVRMSPETARELAYTDNLHRGLVDGIENREIRVRGHGVRNQLAVRSGVAALRARQLTRSGSIRLNYVLPTRYSIGIGDSAEITHRGRSVTLERNVLGSRVIYQRDDREFPSVVDRAGVDVGVTTRGAQRMIAAPTPTGWEAFSGPQAGVYHTRRTYHARQAAASRALVTQRGSV